MDKRSHENISSLAGSIAHELNNQLTPLLGYLDLVIKDTPAGDPRRVLLAEAEQAARRCAEAAQRLLKEMRVHSSDTRAESPNAAAAAQAIPRGHETILFADDEEALRNLGRLFLERLGYRVLLAKDGEETVHLYEAEHPRIAAVILDMTMPKLTGKQTLKKLLEINSKAKVLLSSGFTTEGAAKELIQEGAADFLAKPYTIHPLAQMLRKVIDK